LTCQHVISLTRWVGSKTPGNLPLPLGRNKLTTEKEQEMTREIDRIWKSEARIPETRQLIRDIKYITRGKFTAEEKMRLVLEGFRRDTSIRDLCRRVSIKPGTYYDWSPLSSLSCFSVSLFSPWLLYMWKTPMRHSDRTSSLLSSTTGDSYWYAARTCHGVHRSRRAAAARSAPR
jgi:hypothetical protein